MRKGHFPRQAAAIEWLREKLNGAGERGFSLEKIINAARQHGVSRRTLFSIKKKYSIESRRNEDGMTFWVKTTPWVSYEILPPPPEKPKPLPDAEYRDKLLEDPTITQDENGLIVRQDGKPLWLPDKGLTVAGHEYFSTPSEQKPKPPGDVDF